jgi:hypothetical protein
MLGRYTPAEGEPEPAGSAGEMTVVATAVHAEVVGDILPMDELISVTARAAGIDEAGLREYIHEAKSAVSTPTPVCHTSDHRAAPAACCPLTEASNSFCFVVLAHVPVVPSPVGLSILWVCWLLCPVVDPHHVP